MVKIGAELPKLSPNKKHTGIRFFGPPCMTSANGNSSVRTENSVFLAPELPFYLLCVIFSLLHFFRSTAQGGMAQVAQW